MLKATTTGSAQRRTQVGLVLKLCVLHCLLSVAVDAALREAERMDLARHERESGRGQVRLAVTSVKTVWSWSRTAAAAAVVVRKEGCIKSTVVRIELRW